MLLAARDVARVFGVSTETVRRWEREGKIARAGRSAGGQRRWDSALLTDVLRARELPVPAEWIRSDSAAA
jgi:DNA-binding transcriptional MerR regulator